MPSLLGSLLRVLQQLLCSSGSQQQAHHGHQGHNAQQYQGQQHQGHPQGSHPQSHPHGQPQEHKPHPPVSTLPHAPEHRPHQQNENLINQNDEHYKQLRARANQEGDAMARCFDDSHRAYEAGDGARAKELSNQGHAHQQEMNNLNAQASDWIYHANNTDSQPGEIDLHGLYVKEATTYTERAIQEAQARGDNEVRLIVGKGLHSNEHVAKLKPAIVDLMQKYNIAAHLDEHNSGVLVVALDGRRSDRTLGSDDITRRLERKDEDCVVM